MEAEERAPVPMVRTDQPRHQERIARSREPRVGRGQPHRPRCRRTTRGAALRCAERFCRPVTYDKVVPRHLIAWLLEQLYLTVCTVLVIQFRNLEKSQNSSPCTSDQRIGLNGGGDMSTLGFHFSKFATSACRVHHTAGLTEGRHLRPPEPYTVGGRGRRPKRAEIRRLSAQNSAAGRPVPRSDGTVTHAPAPIRLGGHASGRGDSFGVVPSVEWALDNGMPSSIGKSRVADVEPALGNFRTERPFAPNIVQQPQLCS